LEQIESITEFENTGMINRIIDTVLLEIDQLEPPKGDIY
jgi:hypothetical protein